MRKIFTLLGLLAASQLYAQKQKTLTSGGPLKPEQAIMDIRHYTITLTVDPAQRSIDGNTTVDMITSKPTKVILLDLLDSFKVSRILVNNKPQVFDYKNNMLTISMDKELPAGKASVQVFYGGKPHVARRPPWDDGFSWKTDSLGHPIVEITAEAAGGKLYFPCKDSPSDEPNEGVDLIITVPKDLVVAGPGLMIGKTTKDDKATFHWKTNYTINNYSIVFNVADYAVVTRTYTSITGRKVPMVFYVWSYHKDKAPYHLELLEKFAHEQEKYLGEYPWAKEKIGIVETMHLGMEHEMMNAYGAKFKYTKVGGQDYDDLMHHEFSHEWWGNKVTAKDWADYWIHEGIGTYADALYIKEVAGEQAYIDHFKKTRFGNKIPVVLGKDLDEEAAYNNDIYGKGSFFMHTLRYVFGDDSLFFRTLKGFVTSPKYTYDNMVTTADVQNYFSEKSGKDLKPLFDMYIYSVNLLNVHVKKQGDDTYLVQLQNMSMPLPMEITTDGVTKRLIVDTKGITVTSKTPPVVDANNYYLKNAIIMD